MQGGAHFQVIDLCQAKIFQRLEDKGIDLSFAEVVKAKFGSEVKVLVDRQVLHEQVILWNKAENSFDLVGIPMDVDRVDLPGQHGFDDVRAGDSIVFNEAMLHNGRPNPSQQTRITLIVNFGRSDAGPWPGYTPKAETLAAVSERQRSILSPGSAVWQEPVLS